MADYYETLQISANAEPETIHRVFRLLAQRFHPDNKESGNGARFRELTEAYQVLSDPSGARSTMPCTSTCTASAGKSSRDRTTTSTFEANRSFD